jgi:hypothetical protein
MAGDLDEVVVDPADTKHQSRAFGLVLAAEEMALRQCGVATFLLNPHLTGTGSADGDIVLNPTNRTVSIEVTLLGAATTTRGMTVTLTDGTVRDATEAVDATAATGSAAHPAEAEVGTPGTFGFVDVRLGIYTLTISGPHAEVGAQIYYTLDGSEPGTGSTLYAGPIALGVSGTVRAVAFANGEVGPETEADFVIRPLAPVISPAGGTFVGSTTVE